MLEVCPVHSKGLPGNQDVRSPTDVDSKRLLKKHGRQFQVVWVLILNPHGSTVMVFWFAS